MVIGKATIAGEKTEEVKRKFDPVLVVDMAKSPGERFVSANPFTYQDLNRCPKNEGGRLKSHENIHDCSPRYHLDILLFPPR